MNQMVQMGKIVTWTFMERIVERNFDQATK